MIRLAPANDIFATVKKKCWSLKWNLIKKSIRMTAVCKEVT